MLIITSVHVNLVGKDIPFANEVTEEFYVFIFIIFLFHKLLKQKSQKNWISCNYCEWCTHLPLHSTYFH